MNNRRLAWMLLTISSLLCALRFCYLTADFPNNSAWMVDQAKFTDEGWWASGAVMHHLLGHWHVAGDYNPAAALPVWPALLALLFHFTGVSIVVTRALNVAISIATLPLVFLLVRRYAATPQTTAALAVLLLSASPFAFVFSRLAILDTLVIFQFCLLLLIASCAAKDRLLPLAALALLTPVMLLTKTTAALLLPAVFWLAWSAMGRTPMNFLRAVIALAAVPFLVLKSYTLLIFRLGYRADYQFFYGMNGMPDIDWSHAFTTIASLLHHCIWIDRILYPASLVILLLSILWLPRLPKLPRLAKLWSNPLFTASWIAFACQAVFIFNRQDDYAPRYFLVMLVPLVLIPVLALDALKPAHPKLSVIMAITISAAIILNIATIVSFLRHPEFQFYNAAQSIGSILDREPQQKRLILGVSGSQLSLMTGIPSINDAYGTLDLAPKLLLYQPGWYVVWNGIGAEDKVALSPFRTERVASYRVFDDDDRNLLILYRMTLQPKIAP